jgi:hypothetical protein
MYMQRSTITVLAEQTTKKYLIIVINFFFFPQTVGRNQYTFKAIAWFCLFKSEM